VSWVKSQSLWRLATKKASQERPKWTDAFWRKVKELYVSMGGRFEEETEEPELESDA
jgi:hypothetical protein